MFDVLCIFFSGSLGLSSFRAWLGGMKNGIHISFLKYLDFLQCSISSVSCFSVFMPTCLPLYLEG